MDFRLTDEQQSIREVARKVAATGTHSGWSDLSELGWLDPRLPAVASALIAEECADAAGLDPWLITQAFALPAFHAAGTEPTEPTAYAPASRSSFRVHTGNCGTLRVSGTTTGVAYADGVTALLVTVPTEDGAGLYEISGVTPTETSPTVDGRLTRAAYEIADAPARRLVRSVALDAVTARQRAHTCVHLAAQSVGLAQAMLSDALAYARSRVQFGRPIGSFQAISHRLVDVYATTELARSLVYRAAWTLGDPGTGSGVDHAAGAAVTAADRAAAQAGEVAIQTLGAYGFTWDGPINRRYRRAQWIAGAHESAAYHRDVLAAALLDG